MRIIHLNQIVQINLVLFHALWMECGGFVLNSASPCTPNNNHLLLQGNSASRQDPPFVLFAVKKPSEIAEFEYQEMKIQLDAMKRAGIPSRNLNPIQRQELLNFARTVARKRQSPHPIVSIPAMLPGTTWRLAFSTEAAAVGDLPQDATVYLKFLDGTTLEYILQFSKKTFGLNNLKARSQWQMNTDNGILRFVYDKITSDIFGLKDVQVGLFGLLKGRANYVETAYFDGMFWIECALGQSGEEYCNVYVREDL
jgi:hypothetical protein